jgi:5-methyltetrahydropteroyltriglutamate--homocysteine methyltransferase
VKAAIANVSAEMGHRRSPYPVRAQKQAARIQLPPYPTTTIGSFPQTAEIRQARNHFRTGKLDRNSYRNAMRAAIAECVRS